MKLLTELLRGVQRLPNAPAEDTTMDLFPEDGEQDGEQQDGDQLDAESDDELDGVVDSALEDPNKMGLIRTVKKAHLVYKRTGEDGTFTELWVYNLQNMQQQIKIKRAILAGTDIEPNQTTSPDGLQSYMLWSAGNVEMLEITGLPS